MINTQQALTQQDLTHNPHPHLHRLRSERPVAWVPVLNGWLVTRYDLATAVMRDASTFTVDHPSFSTAQVVGQSMLSRDGAEHQRHRIPFDAPFRRRAVHDRFAPSVTKEITTLIAGFQAIGQAELCRDFAAPIAVQTMVDVLGLATTGMTEILDWYDAIVDAVERVTLGEPIGESGAAAFALLREQLLPVLAADSDSSLLAMASGMAQGLTDQEIVSNAAVLLFGGIETTEGMIANALYYLLTTPPVMAAVQADLALIPAVVEETLRLEPAAAVVDRYATVDTTLAGVNIAAGDLVRVSLSGANRDPAIFPNPDRFDPRRSNLRTHVAFAQGPHVCLGLHLARLETVVALTELLRMLPELSLVTSQKIAAQPHGLVFRKPQALSVTWRSGLKGQ